MQRLKLRQAAVSHGEQPKWYACREMDGKVLQTATLRLCIGVRGPRYSRCKHSKGDCDRQCYPNPAIASAVAAAARHRTGSARACYLTCFLHELLDRGCIDAISGDASAQEGIVIHD